MPANPLHDLSAVILSKYSIVYVHSWEEARVMRLLAMIAEKQFSKPMKLFTWSQSEGARFMDRVIVEKGAPIRTAAEFLHYAIRFDGNALFVAKDISLIWDEDPFVKRKIRDLYEIFKGNHKTLFIVSNQIRIPAELSKEIFVYQFPFPEYAELRQVLQAVIGDFKGKKDVRVSLSEEDINAFIRGVMGLTVDEARRAYNKAFLGEGHINRELVQKVLLEKKFLIDKTPGLVYVTDNLSLNEVGGLENLKGWLGERIRCFTPEAQEYSILPPKGLLITGITGCGKSFIAKGIAGLWDMPLVRLDMNQVYSQGESAGLNFENALRTIEAIAPALLWIDEIEKALGTEGGGSEGILIQGAFLTWMQEKTSPVFVVATANKIGQLPAEMLRKGRFDEIFFVDLPVQEERESIFRLHMKKRGLEPGDYDMKGLTAATESYSGSEIEQIVIGAVFRGFMRKEKPNQTDFYEVISSSIPLAMTVQEEIKDLKRWASQRAISA